MVAAATVEQVGRLVDAISRPMRVSGIDMAVTPSIGISFSPHDGIDLESLVNAADAAMYEAKQNGRATYLHAPPGAGKSTGVPPALLDAPWLAGRRIVMLEPRRLAARAVAARMATLRNERVGETIGYHMRMDTKVGPVHASRS